MGKIKSARELAMERTANLKEIEGAAGEPTRAGHEPYFKAASLLASSFLKKESTVEKISETVDRYPAGAREEAISLLLNGIVEGMTMDNIPETVDFCRRYRSTGQEELLEKIAALGRSYRQQVRELRGAAESGKERELLLAPLQQLGIAGSALAGVNVERSPRWQEQLDRLSATTSPELAQLKRELLSSLRTWGGGCPPAGRPTAP